MLVNKKEQVSLNAYQINILLTASFWSKYQKKKCVVEWFSFGKIVYVQHKNVPTIHVQTHQEKVQ